MDNTLIKIQDISLSRNDNNILENISFKIERSKVLNLYGLNGSGKTSLLSIIIGITEPTSGYIKNMSGVEDIFHKIVYIGHKYGIKGNLTVEENLSYSLSDNNHNKDKIISNALDVYKMNNLKHRLAKDLSHGQQKKVSLMKTLIIDSLLWIIDEPYSALDNESIIIFNTTVNKFLDNGGSLLMTNHSKMKNSLFTIDNYRIDK